MYSVEQKQEAIQAILTGKYSLQEATKIYNISTDTLLRKWVTKYTSGEIVKSTDKREYRMTKGRKTTLEERIEITQFTIAHQYNYGLTMEKFRVSYQQIYS